MEPISREWICEVFQASLPSKHLGSFKALNTPDLKGKPSSHG
ncbi:hypothetical protein D187_009703 [Cystobacter fuscus DSM 2262]|uniref:Uncharacterized protein n=1 Tax=Cystobacter fuscus (strain ATCC 25194 / DSM 2262 / NBRC 100088 / M29) TaxID=1242864 RepID=S9Q129_CYSF2|nr:hypothetical protein D187_009703 [Cystobacter fuscus DSM 2262]